ncbi:Crp/Fnr family transcriptional regulator [uncultured Roseivirga sp.]|mgnify:CR=1 FL=1|uniref:Crp/Fnr family transcriptional regulator n=1 Tax=uncultured Roseivirga sp. TaxID=543088 RepID=UPI0030D70094|tara:strand:- start:41959 stop:42528 length:570 start_codon:yes stop_codon:yes gene_type:complete
MHQALRAKLEETLKISDEDWKTFESILYTLEVKKADYILKAGQICNGIYFLREGAVRTFYLKDGQEINTSFNFENDFLREIESLANNQPSEKYIQAIENSKLFYIEKSKLTGLYQQSIFFQELGRRILEQLAITEQKYSALLAANSPKERYLHILENKPELVHRIPLQHLASYLGISRESLSRIRKRVS